MRGSRTQICSAVLGALFPLLAALGSFSCIETGEKERKKGLRPQRWGWCQIQREGSSCCSKGLKGKQNNLILNFTLQGESVLVSRSSVWFCQSLSSSRPSERRRRLIPNSREQKRDRAPCPAVPAKGTPRSPSQFAQVAPKPEGIPQKQGTLRKLSSARIGSGQGLRDEQGLARL